MHRSSSQGQSQASRQEAGTSQSRSVQHWLGGGAGSHRPSRQWLEGQSASVRQQLRFFCTHLPGSFPRGQSASHAQVKAPAQTSSSPHSASRKHWAMSALSHSPFTHVPRWHWSSDEQHGGGLESLMPPLPGCPPVPPPPVLVAPVPAASLVPPEPDDTVMPWSPPTLLLSPPQAAAKTSSVAAARPVFMKGIANGWSIVMPPPFSRSWTAECVRRVRAAFERFRRWFECFRRRFECFRREFECFRREFECFRRQLECFRRAFCGRFWCSKAVPTDFAKATARVAGSSTQVGGRFCAVGSSDGRLESGLAGAGNVAAHVGSRVSAQFKRCARTGRYALPARVTRSSSARTRSRTLTGFTKWQSKPASAARLRSCWPP